MNSDPCCAICRSSLGICRSKHRCQHHIDAQKQDDANHRARRTVRDPVGNKAVNNVMREKRRNTR